MMGSYWKSMAAEVLPSWLKNLRAGGRDIRATGSPRPPATVAGVGRDGDPEDIGAAAPGPDGAPGTTEPNKR